MVKINNVISDKFNVSSGIPQGRHLSLLLLLILMNDVSKIFVFFYYLLMT